MSTCAKHQIRISGFIVGSILFNSKETKIYHIHSDFTMCEWVHMLQLKIYASIGAIGLVGPQDITQAKLNWLGLGACRVYVPENFPICINKDYLWGYLSNNFESEPVVMEAANNGWARIFAPRFPTWSNLKLLEGVQCRGDGTIWHLGQFDTDHARRTIWHLGQFDTKDNLTPSCKIGQFDTNHAGKTIWHRG